MNSYSYDSEGAAARRDLLGPVRQLGYVVGNVESSAHDWVRRTGIGPWRMKPSLALEHCRYKGDTISIEVAIASSYSNGVEIELISQVSGPPSMYTDFLTSNGSGAQHICFYPRDYQATFDTLVADGLDVVLDGVIHGTSFAYLDDHEGQVFEIADLSTDGLASRAARANAATTWDGVEPFRY